MIPGNPGQWVWKGGREGRKPRQGVLLSRSSPWATGGSVPGWGPGEPQLEHSSAFSCPSGEEIDLSLIEGCLQGHGLLGTQCFAPHWPTMPVGMEASTAFHVGVSAEEVGARQAQSPCYN